MSDPTENVPPSDGPYLNTDRELFREDTDEYAGSYYENSLHVTAQGHIGMKVGGLVITMPIAEWHALATPEAPRNPDTALVERVDAALAVHEERASERELTDPNAYLRRTVWTRAREVARAALAPTGEPTEREACCASGRCEVCDPTFVWGQS